MLDFTIAKDFPLSDEQNEVIDFMIRRSCAVCSAQTGLGKTLCLSTAAMHVLHKYQDTHLIIICPQRAVKAFKKELGRLHCTYNTLVSGGAKILKSNRVTIVTHSMIGKYIQEIVDLRASHRLLAIVDECHALSDPDSKFYKDMVQLRRLFAVFWGATATPLKNDILGMYWMLSLVKPGCLGSEQAFKYKYLNIKRRSIRQKIVRGGRPIYLDKSIEEVIGYKNLDLLKQILDDIVIIRQLQYNLNFEYHKVRLTDDEAKYYMMAGKGIFLGQDLQDNWAVRLHQLQRVVDNVHEDYITNQDTMSSKEKLLMSVVFKCLREGNPCIIYFDYVDALNRIKYILTQTQKVTGLTQILEVSGEINMKERERVEDSINATTVVLVTRAGSESINLQKANTVIFYDIPFAIQSFLQMVGRVTRMDSKFGAQNVHFIEAEGTSDTYRRLLIQVNGGLIMGLFGKVNTLPLDVNIKDKKLLSNLKKLLLWSFKQGKIATEEDIDKLLSKYNLNV